MRFLVKGEPFREINTFRVKKTTRFDYGFEGTVVNRALLSLRGGSLVITLTVPIRKLLGLDKPKVLNDMRNI